MQKTDLSILKTLAWFDVFDFPLTAWETWKYVYTPPQSPAASPARATCEWSDIQTGLARMINQRQIETASGYYFLPGRQVIVVTRKQRYVLAERKFRKALRVCSMLKLIPWIRLIAVCNTLGYSNAPDDSDTDLFIVSAQRRVWLTRFWVIGFLKVFGLRPLLARFGSRQENRRDKIDANFFLDENSLNIESLAIANDIYLQYWLVWQTPIYDPDNIYEKLIDANAWIKDSLPNTITYLPSYRRRLGKPPAWYLGSTSPLVTSSLIDYCEYLARRFQMAILPRHLKELANQNTNVIINDQILKFHDQDRRVYFRNKWLEKLQQLNLI